MNPDSNDEDIKTKTTTRRYNREELFGLAKMMPNTEEERKELEKYEAKLCSKLNMTTVPSTTPEKDDQHLKFIMRRQHSDINFTSLNHERRFNNWRNPDRSQLSGKTSNFNSLKPEGRKGEMESFSHNRVFPHNSKSVAESNPINANRQAKLIRSTSNVTNWNRPNSFYGAPRYRALHKEQEELHGKHSLLHYGQPEGIDFSPIQRFGLVEKTSGEDVGELKSIEDDDFDLTNLLSITVLSDIKTIRHDSQPITGRRSNINDRTSVRTQNDPATRPFTRSQTSTDFTYNGRRLNSENNRLKHDYRFQKHPIPLAPCDATPDLFSFNQSNSAVLSGSMVGSQFKTTRQPAKEAVDKRDAIIESFRAQVRARAMDPTLTPSKPQPTDINTNTNSTLKEQDQKQEANVSTILNTTNVKERRTDDSAELSHALSAQVDETISLPIQISIPNQCMPKKSQIPCLVSLHKGKFPSNITSIMNTKTKSNVSSNPQPKQD